MLLVNHAFARVTLAIFVIFVVLTGCEQETLVLLLRAQIRHFCRFRQNTSFWQGTKAQFTKGTVFWTLRDSFPNH